MQRGLWIASVTCLCFATQACGDDDAAADGGADASRKDAGRSGKAGSAGSRTQGGAGGSGGAGSAAGAAGTAGAGGAAGAAGTAGADAVSNEPTRAVTIRFKAKIGADDLECGKSFPNQGKSKVSASVQDFRFFVEDIRLITIGGVAARVVFDDKAPFQTKDVALVDFTDRQGTCTAGGATINTAISGKVAPDRYAGIVFVIGVPEMLNHQNLTSAKPPLQDVSTHWGWASGYRFIMTGVVVDAADRTAPDPGDSDAGVVSSGANIIHVGGGGCTGTNAAGFTCTRPYRARIKLDAFDAEMDTIVADLGKVFEDIDLKAAVECHGPDPVCGPAYEALGLNIDTGLAVGAQKVFRVE